VYLHATRRRHLTRARHTPNPQSLTTASLPGGAQMRQVVLRILRQHSGGQDFRVHLVFHSPLMVMTSGCQCFVPNYTTTLSKFRVQVSGSAPTLPSPLHQHLLRQSFPSPLLFKNYTAYPPPNPPVLLALSLCPSSSPSASLPPSLSLYLPLSSLSRVAGAPPPPRSPPREMERERGAIAASPRLPVTAVISRQSP
jgi:hypothetical protein